MSGVRGSVTPVEAGRLGQGLSSVPSNVEWMNESRERDILWMTIAIQLSIFAVVFEGAFVLLVFVSGFVTLAVVVNELARRLEAYAGR